MASKRSNIVPLTISESIYQYLKEEIINNNLKPGQRIKEKEMALLFNVSITPVREAFFRLISENYINIAARNKFVVINPSYSSAKDLYEIVRVLDKFAMTKVLINPTADFLVTLKRMTARLEKFYFQNEKVKYLEQNLRIHNHIWVASKNSFLYELLTEIMNKIEIYRKMAKISPYSSNYAFNKSLEDHLKIVNLIEVKDLEGLKDLIDSHWGEEFIKEDNDELSKAEAPKQYNNRKSLERDKKAQLKRKQKK